tara:strand:+ start:56 stop:322 length:267 start_codon:yes stop_codon:yes gene_type:complete
MCLFRSAPATPLPTPAPIQPRQPDIVRESQLPTKKELLDPEEVAGVEYGTSAKKTDPRGAAKRVGTDALKINVNTGGDAGAGTGGLNV